MQIQTGNCKHQIQIMHQKLACSKIVKYIIKFSYKD